MCVFFHFFLFSIQNQFFVRSKLLLPILHGITSFKIGSDAANFDFKADPEQAAGKYQISLKLKLPHLASILDGHFVAGYRIWE
jgi:hypothetical protein